MQGCDDLVLATMFTDAQFIHFDQKLSVVSVSFLKKFIFFQDILEKDKQRWIVMLQKLFGHNVQLQFNFDLVGEHKQESIKQHIVSKNQGIQQVSSDQKRTDQVDVSDRTTWKLAHELMKHFDGVITEISRDLYE